MRRPESADLASHIEPRACMLTLQGAVGTEELTHILQTRQPFRVVCHYKPQPEVAVKQHVWHYVQPYAYGGNQLEKSQHV